MSNGASARRQASRGSTHRVRRDCGSTPNGNFQRPLYRSPPTYRLTWSDLIRASRSMARSCAASGATRPVGARFSAIWLMECLRSTGTIDHMPESTRAAIRPLLIDRDVMPDLEDTNPPVFEQPVEWVCGVHRVDRNVAVHCVTRAALALMMTAWDGAGHGEATASNTALSSRPICRSARHAGDHGRHATELPQPPRRSVPRRRR